MRNDFQVFACLEDKQYFQGLISLLSFNIYVFKFFYSLNVVPIAVIKVELKHLLRIKKSKDVDMMKFSLSLTLTQF